MAEETPQPSPTPAPEPTPEPSPEGVIEVQGRKMVPVDALITERERARASTEKRVREEYAPIQAEAERAKQLQADLDTIRPQIEYLQQHPELLQRADTDDKSSVSDADAKLFAEQYELYTPTGLDTKRAKQIIANQREEMAKVAKAAAQEAVGPFAQQTATQAARQNFLWAAQQRDPDGSPLVDPEALAKIWSEFPAELAAVPEIARVILEAAIGRGVRGGTRPARVSEPTYTEAPGGGFRGEFKSSPRELKVAQAAGMTKEQYEKSAKTYRPDSINILGD